MLDNLMEEVLREAQNRRAATEKLISIATEIAERIVTTCRVANIQINFWSQGLQIEIKPAHYTSGWSMTIETDHDVFFIAADDAAVVPDLVEVTDQNLVPPGLYWRYKGTLRSRATGMVYHVDENVAAGLPPVHPRRALYDTMPRSLWVDFVHVIPDLAQAILEKAKELSNETTAALELARKILSAIS